MNLVVPCWPAPPPRHWSPAPLPRSPFRPRGGHRMSVTYTVQSQWSGGFTANVASRTSVGHPELDAGVRLPEHRPEAQPGLERRLGAVRHQGHGGEHELERVARHRSVHNRRLPRRWSGTNPVPASFSLNGTTCTGSVPTSPPSSDPPSIPPSTPPGGRRSRARAQGFGKQDRHGGGREYRLLGVSRSSGEFACVQGKGLWDSGPVDQASVDAMKTWNIHGTHSAQRGVLAGRQRLAQRRRLPAGRQGLREPAGRQRHQRDPGSALDVGRLHDRAGMALQGGARDLPEAGTRREVRPASTP